MARINLIIWEKRNGLKAGYVAEKLGISRASYSRIKSGKQEPNLEFAYNFYDNFGDTIPNGNILELLKKE